MGHSDFLYEKFVSRLGYEATPCQDSLFHKIADFISSDESDILVVNGDAVFDIDLQKLFDLLWLMSQSIL